MPQSAEVVRVPKAILEKTWTPWMPSWCAVGVAWVVFGGIVGNGIVGYLLVLLWALGRISSCGVLVDRFGQLQSRKKIV